MKRQILIIVLILFIGFSVNAQKIPAPGRWAMIDSAMGDLDKDGVSELAVAYNTHQTDVNVDENVPRILAIYKKNNSEWMPWKLSTSAVMGSQDGGMMGDPFEGIEIKNGILIIIHFGGSSWKWSQTDKYRFQDGDFYLIGYTNFSGKSCEYWETIDFNLSTGKLIYTKEYEKCDTDIPVVYKREEDFLLAKGLKITLKDRNSREIKLVTPIKKVEVFISSKK